MADDFLEHQRSILEQGLQEVLRRVLSVESELDTFAEERDVETMDNIQEEVLADVLAKLDDRERQEVEDFQAALTRISDGSYGRCQSCGTAIARERLEAVPTARLCLPCKQEEEAGVAGQDRATG